VFGKGTGGNMQKSAIPVGSFFITEILCAAADSTYQYSNLMCCC